MAIDIVTRQEYGAPLPIVRHDRNWEVTREEIEDLKVKFAAGIRPIAFEITEDGLIFYMSDESVLGPHPLPTVQSRLRGPWVGGGATYELRDQVYVAGVGSAVATLEHDSGADFQTDFDAGRWQMVSADGEDGSGGGKVLLSLHRPGAITTADVGDARILMIPVPAVGLGAGVLWHLKTLAPPGAGESFGWEISHVTDTGSMAIAWGTISGTNTSATAWVGDTATFAAGDMLAIAITAASAACAASDLIVGIVLGEA